MEIIATDPALLYNGGVEPWLSWYARQDFLFLKGTKMLLVMIFVPAQSPVSLQQLSLQKFSPQKTISFRVISELIARIHNKPPYKNKPRTSVDPHVQKSENA